jgi:hypothetical protein
MPLPSAASEGAAIGAGMEQAGEDVNTAELTAYRTMRQQQADQQAADFDHQFAQTRANMDVAVQAIRGNSPPGAPAHTQNVMAALDTQKDPLFSGITDLKVQQHAQAQWDTYSNSLQSSEAAWQNGQQIGKQVTDFTNANNVSQNRLATNPSFQTYQQETVQRNSAIDAMQGVPGNVKETLRTTTNSDLATAFIQGTTTQNPTGALQMIDQGLFNDVLKPEERKVLRDSAEVEIRRQEALARQQADVSKAAVEHTVSDLETKSSGGIDVSKDIPAAIAAAQALGMTPQVDRLKNLAGDQEFTKVFNQQTPLQRNQAQADLAAKENPTEDDQRELHWLQTNNPKLTAKFNEDPAGFMANNGHTPPPIGPQREQWAAEMGTATKMPASMFMLTAAEAKQLGDYKNSGQQGTDQALSALDRFSPGAARAAAARQVAPSDQHFQQYAQLDPEVRGTIEQGNGVLKGQPQFFGTKGTMPAVQTTLTTQEGQLRQALALINSNDVNTTVQQVRAHMAGTMTAKGVTPDQTSATLYQDSARKVLGGGTTSTGQQVGGLGTWGTHPVLLPNTINNLTFNNQTRGFLAAHPPINGNGTPISIDTIWPAAAGNNTYKFIGADHQFVVGKNGKPLVMGFSGPIR